MGAGDEHMVALLEHDDVGRARIAVVGLSPGAQHSIRLHTTNGRSCCAGYFEVLELLLDDLLRTARRLLHRPRSGNYPNVDDFVTACFYAEGALPPGAGWTSRKRTP